MLLVGFLATKVPGDDPVMLDVWTKVWARGNVCDAKALLRRMCVENPRHFRSVTRHRRFFSRSRPAARISMTVMEIHTLVANSAAQAADVVQGVKNDQLTSPTPCRDWNVQKLTNHLLQIVNALTLSGQGKPVPDELWGENLFSDDWAAQFVSESRQAATAWADESSRTDMSDIGPAQMPTVVVATMLASDLVIHGWDLAKATGQGFQCDGEVAAMTYAFISETAEQGRGMGLYADPVPVSPQAPALDRALGLSGRDPQWRSE